MNKIYLIIILYIMSDVNSITNQLLLKYDSNFNKLYNKKLNIDSSIMNKEEIIIKENNEISRKENIISILNYSIISFIIIFSLFLLNTINFISKTLLLILSLIVIVIYLIFIYRLNNYYKKMNNLNQSFRNAEIIMDEYLDKTDKYKCPSKCNKKPGSNINPNLIQGYAQPTLNINPQLNVWEYGDIPESLWTSKENPSKKFYTNQNNIPNYYNPSNNPKQIFKRNNTALTYYKCDWLGDNNNEGLPNSDKKYSSIPCTYKPNYTESARYICTQDPNNYSGQDISKYCDLVSGGNS